MAARAHCWCFCDVADQTEASYFTTEITEATEPDRKVKKGGSGPNPFFPSDLCVLCALCGEKS
jgi:hypothetical protein